MFINTSRKEYEFKERIRKAGSLGSLTLLNKGLDLGRNDKARRSYLKLKDDAERAILGITNFSCSDAENKVSEYERLKDYIKKGEYKLEDTVISLEKVQERINAESTSYTAQLGYEQIKGLKETARGKCNNSIKALKEQLHYITDYSLGFSKMQFQKADSIYQEFKQDLAQSLRLAEQQKQREFEERQRAKSLEIARLKEEEEKRLDLDRDKQIAKAQKEFDAKMATSKKQFQNQIAAYDLGVQKELEQYKKELALKYHKLDEKEAMIEQFLKEKQKEMYNKMVQQSDNIINDLAEQKAAEILKKLGIKL